MNLKKSLIAAIISAGAVATPALAGVTVGIGIGVPLPPPAPVYEAPPAPAYGYVWAPGYWAWFGNRYIWVRGRYIAARPGYAWAPEHWEHRGERYHFVQGDWRRDAHEQAHERHVRDERHENRGHGHGHDR